MSELFTQGHACIIGVGGDLPNTVDDAIGFAQILQDPERCAYPVSQVSLLTKEEAKRDNILAALDRLAQSTTPDSTVIVYFSGHGYQVSSSMGTAYYLMAFGYDQNQLYSTAISGAEFATKLQAIPAKKLLVLLDCCHAGGLGDTQKIGLTAEKAPIPPEAQALLAEGKGRVFIASSRADEKSLAGKPYSAFTLALIESLAGKGASQQDGYVRVADVALYAREVVPKWTGNRQHPILNFEQADNFVLAYYAGGETEPKGLPFAGKPEIESEAGEFNRQVINHTEVIASGDRAVAVQNAQGATIVTGDGNFIGSKTVNQRGKYTISIDRADHLHIGDRISNPQEKEKIEDNLSAEAVELLTTAMKYDGSITKGSNGAGETFFQTQSEYFPPEGHPSPRSQALWVSAFNELINRQFIENTNGIVNYFKITKLGFEYIDLHSQ
jgi:Caspase domain